MKPITWVVAAAAVLLVILIRLASGVYIDWLWFEQLGFASVFVTAISSYWVVRLAAWLIFALFLYLNLMFTLKALLSMPNPVLRQMLMETRFGNLLTHKRMRIVFLLVSVLVPWLLTAGLGDNWLNIRLFLAGGSTGTVDPIFSQDVAFYLFSLPFLELVYQYLMFVIITATVFCGAIYLFIQPPQQLGIRNLFVQRGQVHLSVLVAAAFITRALGYRLQMYGLLLSERGATFGPGYTDIHAQLPAYWVLLALSVLAAAALLMNIRLKNSRLITGSIVALLVVSIVLGGVVPGAVQSFIVEPNEFNREAPYLEHNIAFTQMAFGLDQIERREFPLTGTLGYEELLANEGTLHNVRLWDYRPLGRTFNQLQSLRRYYVFNDVDTDRYMIDGEYRQVMLSARELSVPDLPSRTWVNERLMYTHGYGLVVSPVNEVTSQGQPNLVVRDLPVRTETDLQVDVPQIYYGELTDNYIFTGTNTDEFDYPMGETNAFYRYEGDGGIEIDGMLRRLLFAIRFGDYRILISGELTSESRIHYERNIANRVRTLAPFLQFDEDPYLVAAEGRLSWIIDAYTTSNNFPYAEPFGGVNYIRNSVKTVVDAYHGSVDFYVFEPEDPMIKAYAEIFPGLFKSRDEMPQSLQAHIRYPETLFKIQSQAFATYHMENPQVFYNREDQWQWPQEIYEGSSITMEPYYTIINLPQEEEPEFVLMLPYTPVIRDNMVAWMAGRSDGEHYGELIVYQFPRGELLYGPSQIEARIDQDSRISEQLTLWDQRGSSVIRGNLLVLPINGSILYVEPIYLRAETGELPELARVIVAYGERVVMERTLEEALAAVFGVQPGVEPDPDDPTQPLPPIDLGDAVLNELIERAAQLFAEAEQAQRQGDWAEYGRLQQELGTILARLQEVAEGEPLETEDLEEIEELLD
ncbi:UPF0182 family membrane protein [Dethiobacter alkaliphilus]|uniref:UPF0182 protein DealDRAFT_0951 n=1 Tax=Dethiobacter alkaliphilus AHT 1 TaxID=555088 RepID=C0GEP2_DETAL|nr:UPF0182 family protein [Dethiobacter alkaliphilus]EEG78074.1 protein of unknown function UPF0182 [Dethiobacter alkaliphilus AHT 1]